MDKTAQNTTPSSGTIFDKVDPDDKFALLNKRLSQHYQRYIEAALLLKHMVELERDRATGGIRLPQITVSLSEGRRVDVPLGSLSQESQARLIGELIETSGNILSRSIRELQDTCGEIYEFLKSFVPSE